MESIREWAVEWVEESTCSLISGSLVLDGCDVEGWYVRRAELTFFSFDGVDKKHQGQQLQQREYRTLFQQLAVLCSISIRE